MVSNKKTIEESSSSSTPKDIKNNEPISFNDCENLIKYARYETRNQINFHSGNINEENADDYENFNIYKDEENSDDIEDESYINFINPMVSTFIHSISGNPQSNGCAERI
ncbi:hypothetical protein H8356DRAFT_1432880 [Neocallimastix lanati (nom. inval.)]|nr:hypothetical protein H8356DRAFT_1432880 [Neocallimastix sp. JGI-2020a]